MLSNLGALEFFSVPATEDAVSNRKMQLTDNCTRKCLLSGIPRTSHRIKSGKALLDRGQSWKGGMRFLLVPIRDRKKVVGAMIGMAMLDRRCERLGKRNRRIQMKPIHGRAAARNLGTFHGRSEQRIGERMIAKVPSSEKVIFRPSTVNGGTLFPVDKKHVVAFTPPAVLILKHRHGHADEVSLAGGFHPHVVAFSIKIFLRDYGRRVV